MHTLGLAKETLKSLGLEMELTPNWRKSPLTVEQDESEVLEHALKALYEADLVIRSQAEQIRQLEGMALTDELTGLLNRRGFTMALHRELSLARRDKSASGLLVMVDLDGFKAINDMWGHSVGDDYLQAVAHALLSSVRNSDVVARIGGDEFAVMFTHMSEEAGRERVSRLEKTFNSRFMQYDDKTLPLRASFGGCFYNGMDTPEVLLSLADAKLYAQKAQRVVERQRSI
ncbi:MAG: GGDEF domain-containing protein [Alphaproteobacteria bacterium]|nr:GGDEF domain-containing protein [Alphaproteobacteria bacterium]